MKLFLPILVVLLLFSCGKKQSQKDTTPTRTETTPRYELVDLPKIYLNNFKMWEQSVLKECSVNNIFKGLSSNIHHYDYDKVIPEVQRVINSKEFLGSDKQIILHPDWKDLAIAKEYYYEQVYIKNESGVDIGIQLENIDGFCHIKINNQLIYIKKLLETIPLLYSFEQTRIEIIKEQAHDYKFDQFKNIDMIQEFLLADEFFKDIDNLVKHERLSSSFVRDTNCQRPNSLFTMLKDDEREKRKRCLYKFKLRMIGIDFNNNFLYQLNEGTVFFEKVVSLSKLNKYEISPEMKDFEKEFSFIQFNSPSGIIYDYSLRPINNCHILVNFSVSYLNAIDSFDIFLNDKWLDVEYRSQRDNNYVKLDTSTNSSRNLIIKFEKYKNAKKFAKDIIDLRTNCGGGLF